MVSHGYNAELASDCMVIQREPGEVGDMATCCRSIRMLSGAFEAMHKLKSLMHGSQHSTHDSCATTWMITRVPERSRAQPGSASKRCEG